MSPLSPACYSGTLRWCQKQQRCPKLDPQVYIPLHTSLLIILHCYKPSIFMVAKPPRAVNTSQEKMLRLPCSLENVPNS